MVQDRAIVTVADQ